MKTARDPKPCLGKKNKKELSTKHIFDKKCFRLKMFLIEKDVC